MGSWNATCYMSNLPINPGDRVALLMLAPLNRKRNRCVTCNAEDFMVHIGSPIFGEYEDSGILKNIDSNPYMEQYLKEFSPLYTCDNQYGSNVYEWNEYEWENIETFLHDVCHHYVFVNSTLGERQELDFVMIHEELYHKLLQEIGMRIPYDFTESLYDLHEYKIRQTLMNMREKREMAMAAVKDCSDEMSKQITLALAKESFCDKYNFTHEVRWKAMDWFANKYLDTNDESIIYIIRDRILWLTVMEYARKAYGAVSGAGSQSCEMKLQNIIATYIVVKCLVYEAECERDGIGSDDDNILRDTMYFHT